ncbi:probable serine/threonine-protein kinase DDB_G0276461 isoform X1 [Cucurbita moschata]|uniref:non-specific serine/threonine protein kinase n=1 Tax=Cucurbita moschata TaxID=3662 RepID=A0A6J1F2N8_CUCMO|nr:probable serine/threonine-protein kinase DDB_G0276461 isoform X1 [Cucurbita moschata]XP_022934742.1 probable serine/threonine-protein kinase DDB_G0276461 isoform X1 [Cucurbita moschata]
MWRFKPFMHKEPSGLEGRSIDVGNLKIQVRNVIAEGGFSCVYLAKDAVHISNQYALKHIICNDEESLELVLKEVSVMKSLRGHPNVVTLYAHTVIDMGRTKEALLVMEFCEKSLVSVLESRGAGYFDENQVLLIFRDVCNAVFAMHCHSPPIAHRDLKAENLLLGSDGLWKLCDFGSTSTNHKRFEKPEEMGVEEDNIRKYTTPAYRAPEMWDLYRRELINEKVDIWALGCLLFRICYFKSAFDGESKLQILNGNYRIPELPKYSSSITNLIRDMLQASPNDRPDITQVWFRANDQLPVESQKSLPDQPPDMPSTDKQEAGISNPVNKSSPMPRRSPPAVPSVKSSSQAAAHVPKAAGGGGGGGGGSLGAFWSTQHANDTVNEDTNRIRFDEESTSRSSKHDRINPNNHSSLKNASPGDVVQKSNKTVADSGSFSDIKLSFFQNETDRGSEGSKASKTESAAFQDKAFNNFVSEFDTSKFSSDVTNNRPGKEVALEAEVEKLKEQLKQANVEKAEITSKFEKLSAICRSQRQEIQELKQALAARSPSPKKVEIKSQNSPDVQPSAMPRLQKADSSTPIPDAKPWQAFAEESSNQQPVTTEKEVKSVRTRSLPRKQASSSDNTGFESWGFGAESFTAVSAGSSNKSGFTGERNSPQQRTGGERKNTDISSQPAGWAGF